MQHGAQHDMLGFGAGSRGIRRADIGSSKLTALTWASCLPCLLTLYSNRIRERRQTSCWPPPAVAAAAAAAGLASSPPQVA